MKICSNKDCSVPQPEQVFGKQKGGKDGLKSKCKVCISIQQKLCKSKYKNTSHGKAAIANYNNSDRAKLATDTYRYSAKGKATLLTYQQSERGKLVHRLISAKRRALKLATADDSLLQESQEGNCKYCKCVLDFSNTKLTHLDHVVPLSKGGTHTLTNVVWSCSTCNLAKGAKIL